MGIKKALFKGLLGGVGVPKLRSGEPPTQSNGHKKSPV